jgi:hypothetical protein
LLPDLPELKGDIQHLVDRFLQKAVQARLGVFADAPRHAIHEGNRLRVLRADGSVEESALKEASAEMTLKLSEIPTMTIEQRVTKLNETADAMARQMNAHLFGALNESLEKAGQVVDRKGKPFDVEAFFAALEAISIDFGPDGKPRNLMFVIPPALAPRVKQIAEDAEKDPAIAKRHDEIMTRKWDEWRDREANRKLVG